MLLRHLKSNCSILTRRLTSTTSKRTANCQHIYHNIQRMSMTTPSSSSSGNNGDDHTNLDGFVEIREGLASMFYDKNEEVFYNKVQVFNRDMSIQVIRLFGETFDAEKKARYDKKVERYEATKQKSDGNSADADQKDNGKEAKKTPRGGSEASKPPTPPTYGLNILDALAATGLRSVRYLKEIPNARHVTINDLLPAATAAAQLTCSRNGVDATKVTINTGDAIMLMHQHKEPMTRYDVIDLDPYGTAAPFLDAAVQAVEDGGLLCVTCTDMPVLSGNYPEVCFAKYGSMPLKSKFLHEMSLRILLHAIDTAANRYSRYIVPWVSLSVDFYVRVFVRVFESPAEVKKSCLRRFMVYQSLQCPSFYLQPLGSVRAGKQGGDSFNPPHVTVPSQCPETGGRMKVGGPFWAGPLHDQKIVDELLRRIESGEAGSKDLPHPVPTASRVHGVLTAISEELKDVPFYYNLADIASTVHSKVPTTLEFHSAVVNAGYRMSQFHHEPMAVKTDAPQSVIWDIMRAYCKLNPPTGSTKKKQSDAAKAILSKEPSIAVDFTVPEILKVVRKKASRFAPNPEDNWGPKRRAGRGPKDQEGSEDEDEDGDKKKEEGEGESTSDQGDRSVHKRPRGDSK